MRFGGYYECCGYSSALTVACDPRHQIGHAQLILWMYKICAKSRHLFTFPSHPENACVTCSSRNLSMLFSNGPSRIRMYLVDSTVSALSIVVQRQVSVSSPTWEMISFLDVGIGSSQVHYGVFGFTGSTPVIGYLFG